MNRRQNVGDRGLTLIEVAVVMLATLSVMALMLPVVGRARTYSSLTNATSEVTSELEYARSEAVKRDGTATVTFSTAGTYTVQYDNGSGLVSVTHYLPQGVSLVVGAGSSAPQVQFFSSGKATVTPAGANIVLQNPSGTRTLAVSVAGNITRS